MAQQRQKKSLLWTLWIVVQFLPLPLRVLFILVVLTIGAYTQFRSGASPRPADRIEQPAKPEQAEADDPAVIESVTLRDEDGEVIYQGSVDLRPTLERIERGERLSRFSHDGSVFSNRERRLPSKPAGYYHEWVQLTPGERGPGPQRIVTGEGGEVWYSSDHYKTFRRIR